MPEFMCILFVCRLIFTNLLFAIMGVLCKFIFGIKWVENFEFCL